MTDWILMGILLLIVGSAILYIVKSKKNGVKCIGCPSGCVCSHKNHGHSGCCSDCHPGTD